MCERLLRRFRAQANTMQQALAHALERYEKTLHSINDGWFNARRRLSRKLRERTPLRERMPRTYKPSVLATTAVKHAVNVGLENDRLEVLGVGPRHARLELEQRRAVAEHVELLLIGTQPLQGARTHVQTSDVHEHMLQLTHTNDRHARAHEAAQTMHDGRLVTRAGGAGRWRRRGCC